MIDLDKLKFVFSDGKGNFQMFEEKPEKAPEGFKESTIDEYKKLLEANELDSITKSKEQTKSNYDALLKAGLPEENARLLSGYNEEVKL